MQSIAGKLMIALLFCMSTTAAFSRGPQKPKEAKQAIVSVKSFGRDNVLGYLGHPLGTVVRVTGVCIDGDTLLSRADAGKTLLKIEMVNGKKLDCKYLFPFLRAARGIEEPLPGQRFDYYVHEYGYFGGIVEPPRSLRIKREPIASDGFYYHGEITIHKANPTTPKAKGKGKKRDGGRKGDKSRGRGRKGG